ncbi:lytic transglycosylase domain-containing protein [Verticiella sediminum]|uniref:lytic transglycosylase domain-containing protein n=1 Tax=Verticiella sediminum TaxID=1247510 RepID=UPI001FE4B526|nr:lytic transglycosylase domain-containing protein [Verticiella sediminum]
MHGFRRAAAGILAVASLGAAPLAQAQTAAAQAQYADVVSARRAADARQWDQLQGMLPGLRDNVLGVYADYWWLRQQIVNGRTPLPMSAITRFIDRHRGSYLAQRVRSDAILAAARTGDFSSVRRLSDGLDIASPQVDCAILHARHVGGARITAADAAAVFRPGNACWSLYDTLVAVNIVKLDDLSLLLRDAIDIDNKDAAQRLGRYMFDAAQQKQLAALLDAPMPWLQRHEQGELGQRERELAAVALARLGRKDMMNGHAYLESVWARRLPSADLGWVQSHFALLASLRQNDVAQDWYRRADGVPLGQYSAEWRVRSALRHDPIDWKWVLSTIEQLPPGVPDETVWLYWRARALAGLGREGEAREIYRNISTEYSYYGQLAAEELGILTSIPPRAAAPTQREMAQARANPGLQRALALFELNWRSEAVPEWNYALRGMSDRELLAAAELAREAHIYDRVVNTSERTRQEHDFAQRFLAPFQGQVTAKAKEIGLDPAWVYGLIRQESRFVTQARSGVGASGLMQLMPATARWVANRIGMADFHPSRVNDFDVNTTLGTNYLNIVLQDLGGSQLLASAGYNAGPKRPHNWRSTYARPVEGAIFAETIPFAETRKYVQNVLSNATYYTALFTGKPQSLKQRLGVVVPQLDETTSVP